MADPQTGAIAALKSASTFEVQSLLARFSERRAREGLRVAGVVEIANETPNSACRTLALREIGTAAVFPIVQDLGRGSVACNLDADGLAAACASVLRSIERGADAVVLSKFGKLESGGGGLLDCFAAAAGAGVPCVAGVSPPLAAAFAEWAGDFLAWVEPGDDAVEAWWRTRARFVRSVAPTAESRDAVAERRLSPFAPFRAQLEGDST
jgi:hypothetical protein